MKPAILAEIPPDDLCAFALQRQPHGNVGFMVKIRNDDFTPLLQRLANGDANKPHERCGVHAEGNFVRMPRVDQQGHAFPRPGNRFVHLLRLPVPAAALHVAMQKMVRDRVQHGLGRLRTGGVIEKNEIVLQ